jgi:hypothetical protein
MKGLRLIVVFHVTVWAQDLPRHTVTVGFVEAFRLGTNSYYLQDRPGLSAGYGARLHRFFQLDAGMDYIPRPLGDSVCCRYIQNAEDNLYLLTLGGRAVLGPREERWLVSIGGGGAYMRHAIPENAEPFVGTSRNAGGGYGLVNGSVGFGRAHQFRIGATSQVYLIHVDRYRRARILTLGPEFGFRF